MPTDWLNCAYLRQGSPRQQAAYTALEALDIFTILHPYSPVLTGTIPLDIDTEYSDLDIICEAHDLDAFETDLRHAFGGLDGFHTRPANHTRQPARVAAFQYGGFEIEIFGQQQPVTRQNAYRHMVVEARLLTIGGEQARQAIRQLKRSGIKTEPAFAQYFCLSGDPYQVLLELALLNNYELRALLARRRFS